MQQIMGLLTKNDDRKSFKTVQEPPRHHHKVKNSFDNKGLQQLLRNSR